MTTNPLLIWTFGLIWLKLSKKNVYVKYVAAQNWTH